MSVGEQATVKPSAGLTSEETLQHIEHCKSWLGLKQLASVPAYCALLDQILDELRPAIQRSEPGLFGRQGYLFISSPRAVVPYHLDPEHNFLFQLRGRKRVTVFDKADRTIVTEGDLERHYATGNRRLLCPSEYDVRARVFELAPGDVLHVPISAPHHVRNRDEVNVSLSVTFRMLVGDRTREPVRGQSRAAAPRAVADARRCQPEDRCAQAGDVPGRPNLAPARGMNVTKRPS